MNNGEPGKQESLSTLAEQVKLVHSQLYTALAGSALAGLAMVILLWNHVSHTFLVIWYSSLLVISIARILITRSVIGQEIQSDRATTYARQYVFASTLAGCVWGAFVIFLPDLTDTLRLVVLMLLVGLVGGAITTTAALLNSYYGFILPILLPLIVRTLQIGGTFWSVIGFVLIVYLVFLVLSSLRLHGILRDSILLRFQKETLFSELEQVKGELEAAVTRLARLSSVDELTGIANRRTFDAAISREWSRAGRYAKTIALLLIDVDFFKNYNDMYMHQAGDKVLQKVAGVINSYARRSSDLAARYGGEEFTLILTDTSSEDARNIAESLRRDVEALAIEHASSECADHVTVSIGVAMGSQPVNDDYSPLISAADEALYKAKRAGRNRVVIHD